MNKILTISIVLLLCIIAGCDNKNTFESPRKKGRLLTIDFQEGETLRYRFVSERQTNVDWNSQTNAAETENSVQNKSTERLDIVMSYTPIEINPFGLTKIKAACENIKIVKSSDSQKDAVNFLKGKTYIFTIDSTGKIHDYSELNELIKEAGQEAFSSGTGTDRIKDPDMIGDFIATQWFLWDSISSIPNASDGVQDGQNWTSQLSVPTPMVSRLARDVTYKYEEIQGGEYSGFIFINSVYSKSDSVPQNWPVPYSGSFQVRGTFGLLGGYKLLDLKGTGHELFNIDLGRIEEYKQQYELVIQASVPMGISVKPVINIEQTISMEIFE